MCDVFPLKVPAFDDRARAFLKKKSGEILGIGVGSMSYKYLSDFPGSRIIASGWKGNIDA